ncbi:MAG TPA: 16S rRNA (guanine(527)-N(7))-methyltransferase RsmG [Burkholderiaceae bacterium]
MAVLQNDLQEGLQHGLVSLGLELSEAQVTALLDYVALLEKWNKVYNLTALRNPRDMLTNHLLDSLAAVGPLRSRLAAMAEREGGAQLLDVGSGGGLPGVVFAICLPLLRVTCVDAVAKKAAFIQQAAATLKLPNLHGVHARVESLVGPFNVVSCRAFASLGDFAALSHQVLAPQGAWLAMKGRRPEDEIAALPSDVQVFHVEPLAVPGLGAERCIVWMRRAVA